MLGRAAPHFLVASVWSAVTELLALASSSSHLGLKAHHIDSDKPLFMEYGLRQALWGLRRTCSKDTGRVAVKEIADAGRRRELRVIDQRGLRFKLYFPAWGHVLARQFVSVHYLAVCPRLSTVGTYMVDEDQEGRRTLVG